MALPSRFKQEVFRRTMKHFEMGQDDEPVSPESVTLAQQNIRAALRQEAGGRLGAQRRLGNSPGCWRTQSNTDDSRPRKWKQTVLRGMQLVQTHVFCPRGINRRVPGRAPLLFPDCLQTHLFFTFSSRRALPSYQLISDLNKILRVFILSVY